MMQGRLIWGLIVHEEGDDMAIDTWIDCDTQRRTYSQSTNGSATGHPLPC